MVGAGHARLGACWLMSMALGGPAVAGCSGRSLPPQASSAHGDGSQRLAVEAADAGEVGGGGGVALADSGAVLPSQLTQAQLMGRLLAVYQAWKAAYLTAGRCPPGQLYLDSDQLEPGTAGRITVSEQHASGMLIVAAMAGKDSAARPLFDDMLRFVLAHPSPAEARLMAWSLQSPCDSTPGAGSASDAELDIAYALWAADRAWGSGGTYDYRALGQRWAEAILQVEVDPRGDFVALWENVHRHSKHAGGTRVSDVMPSHFRALHHLSADLRWQGVLDRGYQLIAQLQANFSPRLGLLPDFAVQAGGAVRPAEANYLEGPGDGSFAYNACRVPLRLAVDALVHQEGRAQAAAQRLVAGLRQLSGDEASRLVDGYTLQGEPLGTLSSASFAAPALLAASLDPGNQPFIDSLWGWLEGRSLAQESAYGNSLRLLVLIAYAGLWPR